MGQQQLLIIILVTIVIGIAVIVGINTMQAARMDSNSSAVRQDILMIFNDAQLYYRKPATMGGGGNSFDGFTKDQVHSISIPNDNGSYEVSGSGHTLTAKGTGIYNGETLKATGSMASGDLEITWTKVDE